jgi:predicted small secreted protein
MKKRFGLITFFLALGLVGIGIALGFLYTKDKINDDKEKLQSKLNELFDSKISISDGSKMAYEGEFTDKSNMHYSFYSGGFTIYDLTKESDGFVKTITSSGDLYYKEAESVYEPPQYFDGYKISGGYNRSNYRPSVQKCYDGAYEYLLKGDEKDRKLSYTPDKLTDIKNFPSGFYSEYHFTEQREHPSEFYYIQNGSGNVYTTVYEHNYNQEKTYYTTSENTDAISKATITNLSFGGFIGLILTFVVAFTLRRFSPHQGEHHEILNIKWRNVTDNSVMTIMPKTLGKYPVTLVSDNVPSKGNAKIKDNSIEISFPTAEYYYQIEKKETDILELKNLTTNEIIAFEKLGTNAFKIRQDKLETSEKENDESEETIKPE